MNESLTKSLLLAATLLFITALVACSSFLALAATPTPLPTTTPTTTSTGQPNTPIAQNTSPATPPPATPSPTITPTPALPSPTSTSSPTATPTITPSPQLPYNPAKSDNSPSTTNSSLLITNSLTRTLRIGLNGRNDIGFHETDYQLIGTAKIELLKMMSLTEPHVFARLKAGNPDLEFIVRLYDDRINASGHPSPAEFVQKMSPIIASLQPYAAKFEIGNEPNHFQRYEGWGPEDADAQAFNAWFLEVYDLLKTAHPWAQFGFPALATPDSVHRDRAWLEFNREAIERADWLGVHCYWQTPPGQPGTMFDEHRGLCFKYYHALFPNKPIELTEFANDNIVYGFPPATEEQLAQQQAAYYQELFKYPYLRSASSYILSSNDQTWAYFAWRTEDGHFKPIVAEISNMSRPPLVK